MSANGWLDGPLNGGMPRDLKPLDSSVHTHIQTHLHTCTHAHMHTCAPHMHSHASNANMYTCMHMDAYRMHLCTCLYVHICMCVRTHVGTARYTANTSP